MKNNGAKMYRDINHVDDDLIEAAQAKPTSCRTKPWVRWSALAACLCFIAAGVFTILLQGGGKTPDPTISEQFIAARALYPEAPLYPQSEDGGFGSIESREQFEAWWQARETRLALTGSYQDALDPFLRDTIPQFLGGAAGQNRVYSPLNVYLAMGMLAEITDGQSRQQILDVMGADSIGTLRSRVSALWNANYQNDGATTCLLAGSFWLRDDMGYLQPTLDALAQYYYASSFRGEMGSKDYNAALQAWLNEQTGGLLADQVKDVELNPDTVIALATAIYFKAAWADEFNKNATTSDPFHAPNGDVMCDFMHSSDGGVIFFGNGFTAYCKPMKNGDSNMWFLLPDEGVTPEELLDGRFTEFLLAAKWDESAQRYWADQGRYIVNLSLPKFDVSSDLDLREGLKALGITDVFKPDASDFSPLTDELNHLFVSKAQHDARVKVDEEGVEAAAFTVIAVDAAGLDVSPEYDFNLDRPFLFAVTGADNLPLFTGIVNNP